jgi:hypothetical protein
MTYKMSSCELEIASAAAIRDDRCLVAPANFNGDQLREIAMSLKVAGLAREIRAKSGAPIWRRDEDKGKSFALKLTAAGLKASLLEGDARSEVSGPSTKDACEPPPRPEEIVEAAGGATETAAEKEKEPESRERTTMPPLAATTESANVPREGTKIANVLQLLLRDEGATLDEVVAATGWLPHTSRAALTGLKKRGYGISRQARANERSHQACAAGGASGHGRGFGGR